MPAKTKRAKPLNILIRLDDGPADKLREISKTESRSNSAQARIMLEKGIEEYALKDD